MRGKQSCYEGGYCELMYMHGLGLWALVTMLVAYGLCTQG